MKGGAELVEENTSERKRLLLEIVEKQFRARMSEVVEKIKRKEVNDRAEQCKRELFAQKLK